MGLFFYFCLKPVGVEVEYGLTYTNYEVKYYGTMSMEETVGSYFLLLCIFYLWIIELYKIKE
jgi:hypothetical protein